jgi:hypothetical protein
MCLMETTANGPINRAPRAHCGSRLDTRASQRPGNPGSIGPDPGRLRRPIRIQHPYAPPMGARHSGARSADPGLSRGDRSSAGGRREGVGNTLGLVQPTPANVGVGRHLSFVDGRRCSTTLKSDLFQCDRPPAMVCGCDGCTPNRMAFRSAQMGRSPVARNGGERRRATITPHGASPTTGQMTSLSPRPRSICSRPISATCSTRCSEVGHENLRRMKR